MGTQDTKIRITAETAEAQRAFAALTGSLTGLKGNLVSFAGAVGGALSVGAFAGFIKSSIDLQDELGTLSKKTGIAASDLGGLKFAADQNGTSLEMVAKGVKQLSINMTDAPDKFKKLGINATDATGALVQIADLVASMPDGMKKTALLAELMGKKVGPEMAEFLSQGGAALQGYIAKGKDVYKLFDGNAEKAKEYKDQMKELEARVDGIGVAFSSKLLPGLLEITAALNDLVKNGGAFLSVGEGITTVFQTIVVLGANVGYVFNQIANEAVGMATQIVALAHLDFKGFKDIGKEMEVSAAKARADIDAFSERILNGKNKTVEIAVDVKPKTVPKSVNDLLDSKQGSGTQILLSLERDYQNELAKRKDALNAPMLSASEKALADDLRTVHKRAQDARGELEKQKNASEGQGKELKNYQGSLDEITAKEREQVKAISDLQAAQDKLNASWEYGAGIAMRKYADEAENTAKLTEKLFTSSFKGMEDALVSFVRTGKLDFSSLADSIISDLIRIQIQKDMAGIMGSLFGSFNNSAANNAMSGSTTGNTLNPVGVKNGGAFDSGMMAFANGGSFTNKMFNSPTPFRFASGSGFGLGVMGEAGPEAVMPLTRGADGKLGVRSQGGGVINNITQIYNVATGIDQAQSERTMRMISQQGNAELVDKLHRQGAL